MAELKKEQVKPDDVEIEEQVQEGAPEEPKVEVDLDSKPDVKKEPPIEDKIKSETEKLREDYEKKLKASRNQAEAQRRQLEKMQKRLDDIELAKLPQPAPQPVSKDADIWGQIQDGPVWRQEISKLAKQEAQALFQDYQKRQELAQAEMQRRVRLESSKTKVVSLYPELDIAGEDDDPYKEAYRRVLNEDPDLYSDPLGPETAMARMEAILAREKGIAPRSIQWPQKQAAKPVAKVVQGSMPMSRSTVVGNKVLLTREEKEFCDLHGIDVQDYARNKRTLEQPDMGGIEA